MAVKLEKFQKGVINYIDNEIVSNLDGWEKIGVGTASALFVSNLPKVIEQFKDKISMFGAFDDKGDVNIEALHDACIGYFSDEGEYIDVPVIGMRLKFGKKDVEKLYKYIKES